MGHATGVWRNQDHTWAIGTVNSQCDREIIGHDTVGLSQGIDTGIRVHNLDAMHLTRYDTALDTMTGQPCMTLIAITLITIRHRAVGNLHSVGQ